MIGKDWTVGMKVVCVSDLSSHPARLEFDADIPEVERIYTIREIFLEPNCRLPDHPFIRLVEIVNKRVRTLYGPYEPAFLADHFRPLVARKTDISQFTALLHTSKQKEDA